MLKDLLMTEELQLLSSYLGRDLKLLNDRADLSAKWPESSSFPVAFTLPALLVPVAGPPVAGPVLVPVAGPVAAGALHVVGLVPVAEPHGADLVAAQSGPV